MGGTIPEGFEALSVLSRGAAERAVDRALRTTDDAIRFVDAVAEAMGPRVWSDPWVKPGGSRRLFAVDPDRPGWVITPAILELSLDVPPPPPWVDLIQLPDGTTRRIDDDRPRPQPEGPNQRSAELRWVDGERVSQWSYDAGGRVRERARGRGAGADATLPFLRDTRLPGPDPQRPHPLFLRPDLDPDGMSPRELAERFAALDFRAGSTLRVHVPVPLPGGPALCARRAVQALVHEGLRGRWGYDGAGWVIVDGYLGEVLATGASFDAALAAWREAVRLQNPEPRDSRATPEERERDQRAYERAVEEAAADVGPDGVPRRIVVRFEPPVQMPFPPRRPECCPAVAIPLPEPPAVSVAWRAAGFDRVVRLLAEDGACGHALLRRTDDGGWWLVGHEVAARLDPAEVEAQVAAADRAMGEAEAAWAGTPEGARSAAMPWRLEGYAFRPETGDGPLVRASGMSSRQPPEVMPDPGVSRQVLRCRRRGEGA